MDRSIKGRWTTGTIVILFLGQSLSWDHLRSLALVMHKPPSKIDSPTIVNKLHQENSLLPAITNPPTWPSHGISLWGYTQGPKSGKRILHCKTTPRTPWIGNLHSGHGSHTYNFIHGGRGILPLLSRLHLDPNIPRILILMAIHHLLPQNNNSRLSPAFIFSSLVLYNYISEGGGNISRKSTAIKQQVFP